jgi:cob(I)alamin adenosyltransferase
MKIYTRTGDAGETSLYGGERRSKADMRVSAYGEVDELQAALGVAASTCLTEKESVLKEIVQAVQKDCFALSSELARPEGTYENVVSLEDGRSEWLEKQIDSLERELPALQAFILPGGSAAGSHFHLARAICRRAERSVVLLGREEAVRPEVVTYVNRLSDLLFVLARTANRMAGVAEEEWRGRQAE